jgi:hypothetical protein
MMSTWTKQGLEQGLEQGQVKGMRKSLQALLDKKFGPLEPDVIKRVENLPVSKVEELTLAILDAKSLAEMGLSDAANPSVGNE